MSLTPDFDLVVTLLKLQADPQSQRDEETE